jgi:hypothetical protein
MKRDFTRDLQVLDRFSSPDLFEEAQRRARVSGRDLELASSSAHRGLTSLALVVVALGIAIGGFVWLNDAFRSSPAPPADATPGYVFTNVRPYTGQPDEDGYIQIGFDVAWSTEVFPGLHRCRYQALGLEGHVVSERTSVIAFRPGEGVRVDVPSPSDEVGSGRVVCDPERLDTPGIAEVTPLDPADVGRDLDRWLDALETRVDEWAARFRIDSMSAEELAWNIEALSSSVVTGVTGRFDGDAQAWAWEEWRMRIARLCVLLPEGHELRNKGCLGAGPAPAS